MFGKSIIHTLFFIIDLLYIYGSSKTIFIQKEILEQKSWWL